MIVNDRPLIDYGRSTFVSAMGLEKVLRYIYIYVCVCVRLNYAHSQIRAAHFKELKKFFSIPSHFRGLSDLFSIFKHIFNASTTQLIDAYEKGEEMFTQMLEHARRFQEWVIAGAIGYF